MGFPDRVRSAEAAMPEGPDERADAVGIFHVDLHAFFITGEFADDFHR